MTTHKNLMTLCVAGLLTLGLAACGGDGGDDPVTTMPDPMPDPGPDPALGEAQQAAMEAATAAMTAATDAQAAVDAVAGSSAADPASFARAEDAADDAQAAYMAAKAASDMAAAATDTATAQSHQANAEAAQTEAETALANAMTFAGMVRTAQQDIDDAAQEVVDLADAKEAAMTAATAARDAADDAQDLADDVVGLVGADSPIAVAAQAEVVKANTAAGMAEEASVAADAAATSGEAQGHQATAETQRGIAEGLLPGLRELRREAQVAVRESEQRQRERLAAVRTDAMDAANDAQAAADEADEAYKAAKAAIANRATRQTSDLHEDSAKDLAYAAGDYAEKAQTAADDAMTAAEAAEDATDVGAATRSLVMAETARDDAMTYRDSAEDKRDAAMTAAESELMIVDTVKSVGETTVDANAPRSVVTTGTGADEKNTITGLLSEPVTAGGETYGQTVVPGSRTDPTVYKAPMVGAAGRTDVKIGKTVDSSDDAARLLIVTHYAGTNSVRVYDEITVDDLNIQIDSDGVRMSDTTTTGTFEDPAPTLRSEGTFYRASAATPTADGLQPTSGTASVADGPVDTQAGDFVAADTDPVTVYSYGSTGSKTYVVEETRTTASGVTTVTYQHVQIHVAVDRDGDTTTGLTAAQVTAVDAANNGLTGTAVGQELVGVTARRPERAAYDHVHFGVWASLGDPMPSGLQSPSELGIGFVQSIGDGMTGSDMPNNGSASYSGNWAAAIQQADPDGDGDISLSTGAASVSANFTKAEITAMLTGLATLEGDISDNTFEGTKVTPAGGGVLDPQADFTGSFSGGFYGAKADETAGIFDFGSDGNKAGAFRGAFGGQRDPD